MPSPSEFKEPNNGARFWRYTIGVETLPAISREKKPLGYWKRYQTNPATDEEFQSWLDNNNFKDGVCILTGRIRHRPDRNNLFYVIIDGDKSDGIKELLTRNGHTLTIKDAAKKWIVEQHKDNVEKAHFGFYSPIRFPEKITDPIIGLEVRCENIEGTTERVVIVTPSIHKDGYPYEIIGTKDPVVLTELQARELIQHINQICIRNGVEYLTKTGNSRLDAKLKNMIQRLTIDNSIEIREGQRNDILIAVADSILFNHSHKVSEEKLRGYFDAINQQLCKPQPLGIKELDQLWERACKFVEVSKEKEKANGNCNGNSSSKYTNAGLGNEIHLPDNPELYDLDKDVYGIMNFSPTILAVARSKTQQITKARVLKNEYNVGGEVIVNHHLIWVNAIIDAIPIKVVKNDNPLEENKTNYTVTFAYKGSKKPFTIGPTTINKMIEELTDRGRVLKKLAATDALTSIIAAYETSDKIEINDQIPTPGYYWRDARIVGYHVTQRLDFDPWNNEEHRREVLDCIKTFDEWQQKNKKKTGLPTSLKWTTLAPFAFITKTQSRGVDKWLPSYYLYLTTDTGKTTIIRDAVLAPWGIYNDGENSNIHFKGPGSLDSPSKFGIAASQTTLPVLGDEIGDMFSDNNRYNNNILLEMQKFAVQNKYIRTRFNENILALASFAYTSNDPPPEDGAARRRFFAIQFYDNETWTEEEKKEYERWMNEGSPSRREKLSVYGDFVASYVIRHPDLVLGYSSYSWYEPASVILKEFYRSVDIEPPSWLDLITEQTIVQEAKEERQLELRGFLQHQVLEAFRRDSYTNPLYSDLTDSSGVVVGNTKKSASFEEKIDYCLDNKSIPFLHRCNKDSDVAITSNIRSELKKFDRTASATTMQTIASKIPSFEYSQRRIGDSDERIWVICGPLDNFKKYLNYKILDN